MYLSCTGASKEAAEQMLEVYNGNVEMAVNMFLEDQDGASSSSHVRDPIPPQQEVLVDTAGFQGNSSRTKRAVHSVFDSFRDFQVETRRQEEMMTGSNVSPMKRSLEDLFRPPLDLMFHGTFQNARDAGVAHQKWLMVNVQNVLEFSCQILNRDIWSNKAVKTVIKEHFIFWQVYLDSAEGQRYAAFYSVSDWPYVAIIDPRTGESLRVWNKIDGSSFCDTLLEFLCRQQSMRNPQKRAKLSVSPLAAEDAPNGLVHTSSRHVNVPEISPPSGTTTAETETDSTPPSHAIPLALVNKPSVSGLASSPSTSATLPLKHTANSQNICKTETFTSVPATHTPAEYDVPASDSKSMLDANEDDQIAAAIKASLVEKIVNGTDSASSDKSNKSIKNQVDCSSLDEDKTTADESWKSYLGTGDEVKMSFLLRYPDGTREQLVIPESAQIRALTLYVASKGFCKKDYEMVINFPRRVLSDMDGTIAVKDLGLHRQETVFVQFR
ncbi:UBX domain-containing protein 7 isoform X2 [Zootermopsis nevadensis]|uniref:UBX domain-containing protein 7 isoform X2 n=1 Tax=Zootermopsis nevadensis TaxID=136037 RepID=UPI000B8ED542|nr:UBX domain-containing protein 7 isoform X2 [Zootermopsis nevadensis]